MMTDAGSMLLDTNERPPCLACEYFFIASGIQRRSKKLVLAERIAKHNFRSAYVSCVVQPTDWT